MLLKFSLKNIFFFIRYRSSSPYSKALCKRKLISLKKWLQSTDYKNIAKVPFPFVNFIPKYDKNRFCMHIKAFDGLFFIKSMGYLKIYDLIQLNQFRHVFFCNIIHNIISSISYTIMLLLLCL